MKIKNVEDMTQVNCRFCNSKLNDVIIDLGESPLANSYLKKEDFEQEKFFRLKVYICSKCFLVQIEEIEAPKEIFSNYAYFSSYSQSWLTHAKKFTEMITTKFNFNKNSLVIEIASNDGYLLQYFQQKKIPILGIEPASNIAQVAISKNIPTKKQTGGKVDKMTRKSINTSARELGIQGPTTLKQSVEPEGETI